MFSNQEAELALNVPVVTLEAVQGDKLHSRFLAGSASIGGQPTTNHNYLHLIRFHPQVNQLGQDATLLHPSGPVAKLQTSPTDRTLVLTVAEQSNVATLWKIPSDILDQQDATSDQNDFDSADNNDNDMDPLPITQTDTLQKQVSFPSNNANDTDHNISNAPPLVDIQWRKVGGDMMETSDDPTSGYMSPHILTLDAAGKLTQWDVEFGAAESTRSTFVPSLQQNQQQQQQQQSFAIPPRPRMACDPHSVDVTAVTCGNRVQLIDWRQDSHNSDSTNSTSIRCHRLGGILDLDFNPNKPHVLATSGQDGMVKFWDLRMAQQPLLVTRGAHNHWVSRVQYNPFHDQLVLTAGTDNLVHLWRMSTISSAPLLTLDDENSHSHPPHHHNTSHNNTSTLSSSNYSDTYHKSQSTANNNNNTSTTTTSAANTSGTSGPNVRVSRHELSTAVYATAWGASDAWIYAAASFDGKIILSHVPSKEKYKILL